ncbi:helix-turn-helix domain-containing protein [Scleromatobacter humisilvae]|uniref:Helix-turn-helix domain-containing protein n=1 Tax=Scleromatobacter humisilvae TaxID=2897159 RepID=A0A9X1YP22_9BURK|nr:helix-turn-helix domain-containing protein [Scleromatobacter humisilvae]MCK9689738.1 helix-turn-helix domain-containing protein [Scleromatobacter humisilvae]
MPKSMAIAVPAPPLGTPEALDELVPGNLIASSKRRPWRDLLVQVFVRQPFQQTLIIPAVPEPLVVWVISGAARVEERELGGEWMANDVHRGNFFLTTTPRPYELRWKTLGPEPFCVLHLYLGLPLMQRATAEVLGVSGMQVALREISGGHDPVLCSLMELLRDEVMRKSASALLVQGVAISLAVHLVRSYRGETLVPLVRHGGLQAFKIHRALASMQARMSDELDLGRLAREAQLSEAHFSRAFKKSTGLAPSRYLTRMRMERARRLLRETSRAVVEVGLEVGYASPSHFAQVFRREVGVLPSTYRAGQ